MRNSICIALVLLSTTYAHAKFERVTTLSHQGMCEASAAVVLLQRSPEQLFVVANDEDNELRVYSAEKAAGPIAKGDLSRHLGLDPDKKADFEGATTLNGKIYWIASHSRNAEGEIRKQRWQFLSTTVAIDEQTLKLSASSSSHDLLGEIAALGKVFADAIQIDDRKSADLAPENNGLNIEGLTVRADGKSMFIALRNPLSPEKKAFVIPLENPEAVTERGEKPILGQPVPLDLGGRGIRSMEYSPEENAYFIIAGPNKDKGSFELYRWPGNAQEYPVVVEGAASEFAAIDDFHPEAMFIDTSGKVLHILSDDGDREIEPQKACKKANDKSFRSFVFAIR
ncbi:hypothetical protein V1291_004520 [Nitrobacteraceae bacterium AZCC 1564]